MTGGLIYSFSQSLSYQNGVKYTTKNHIITKYERIYVKYFQIPTYLYKYVIVFPVSLAK